MDALTNPVVRSSPTFQQWSLVELNELHHQIAALGALLRLQMGDATAARSLGRNLAGFLQNRQAGLQLSRAFPPAVLAQPAVQATLATIMQTQRQVEMNLPVLARTIAATGAPAPGPLLAGRLV